MRTLYRLSALAGAAFLLFLSFGCGEDDPIIPGVTLPPTLIINSGPGLVSADQILLTSDSSFLVNISGEDGDAPLRDLTLLENGLVIPFGQLNFRTGQTANNPIATTGSDAQGFTYEIEITPTSTAPGAVTFAFRLTDTDGETDSREISITYEPPPGTPLVFDTTGVFFNASGSMNGGLDLDNGTAVAFNSTDAEIQDEGIDLNSSGENWRTQVSSVNDAVLRIADLTTLGDGTTFAGIDTQEEITSLYDSGATPAGDDNFPDADGDTSSTEEVTAPLQEGDVLVVRRGDRTYLVRIDAINFVASSNTDSYTVSIKY